MGKRGALFVILAGFFMLINLIGNGSATGSCTSDQILLKLSDIGNAHGEVWDSTNYGNEICYDALFGVPGNGDRTCTGTGTNRILRLSDVTNAHAEAPYLQNPQFAVDVCYGTLGCFAQNTACDTLNGEVEVARLSNYGNAHLALAGPGPYSVRLCCKIGGTGGGTCGNGALETGEQCDDGNLINGDGCSSTCQNEGQGEIRTVEWRNAMGQRITESNVNSIVTLYAETTAGNGQTVTFNVYEKDFGYNFVTTLTAPAGNGKAEKDWLIDDDIISQHDEGADCTLGGGLEFYFNASIPGSSNFSYELLVDCEQGENTPPKAIISAPVHRQIYFTNLPVEFNHTSRDSEGNIVRYLWKIEEDNFQTTQESFIYTFTTEGQKTITLRVEDSEGLSDEDEIAVLAINSPGILAYIEKPSHQQIVPERNGNTRLIVDYSGEHSYVIDRDDGTTCPDIDINCLAGDCPAETMNHPVGCTDNVTVLGGNQPFDTLNFTWKFNDGQVFSGLGNSTGSKGYGGRSDNLNDKGIILKLLYNQGNVNVNKQTDREFTLGQCVGGDTFYDITSEGEIIRGLDVFEEPGACKGEDGLEATIDDCCPPNFACLDDNSNGVFLCRNFEGQPEFCSDYSEQNTCNEDAYHVVKNEPGWDEECEEGWSSQRGQPVECKCEWDDNQEPEEDICKFDKRYIGGGGSSEVCTEYECLESYAKGECKNGYMELTIHRELVDGDCDITGQTTCEPLEETITVPCGRPTIELPFFEKEQFIGALIVIALIYAIVRYMHKEEK